MKRKRYEVHTKQECKRERREKKQRNPWKKIKRREGENLFSEKDEEEAKTSSRALPNRQKNKQITYVDV